MQPKHVKEAFRLLNKSIIRVEQPDIHLEEGQEEEMEVDAGKTTNLDFCLPLSFFIFKDIYIYIF